MDSYFDGQLTPRGNDFELELAPSPTVTLKRRTPAQNIAGGLDSTSSRHRHDVNGSNGSGSRSWNVSSSPMSHSTLDPLRGSPVDVDGLSASKRMKMTCGSPPSFPVMDDAPSVFKIDAAEEVDLTADDDYSNPLDDVHYFDDYLTFQQHRFGHNPLLHNATSALSPHLPHPPPPPHSATHATTASAAFPAHRPPPLRHSTSMDSNSLSSSKSLSGEDLIVDLEELHLPVQKMNFLKSVPDEEVEKLFVKGKSSVTE